MVLTEKQREALIKWLESMPWWEELPYAQLEAGMEADHLGAFSTMELLKELLSRHKLFPAPTTRSYGSGHVEVCISIDDDHTCSLTIDGEALEILGVNNDD